MTTVHETLKILAVDDDRVTRDILFYLLTGHGYSVQCVDSAESALEILSELHFDIVVIDRMLPGIDGLTLCREIRKIERPLPLYLMVCTSQDSSSDILAGFTAGADDYITKPFIPEELLARIDVGQRMISLQQNLTDKIQELEVALEKVKTLEGIIPICSFCKKIRDDKNYWESVEVYVSQHSNALFSHGVCPDCFEKNYGDILSDKQ